MTLKAVIGLGNTIENSILSALQTYNEEDYTEQKTFHHSDLQERYIENTDELECLCIIWYSARKIQQQEPEYKYIGSTGVDPNDPDWLTKWQQSQPSLIEPTKIQDVPDEWEELLASGRVGPYVPTDNTSEKSPDGSGSTEDENTTLDTGSEK